MAQGILPYGRSWVQPPSITPSGRGLLYAADVREVADDDPALRGFAFDSDSNEMALSTVGFSGSADHTNSLTDNTDAPIFTSDDPFSVYGSFAGTMPVRDPEQANARAAARLRQGEGYAAEQAFWTATLAAHAAGRVLSATAVSPKLGLGLLLEWAGKNYAGIPYIHAGVRAVNELAALQLVNTPDEGAPTIKGGSFLVPGTGYFATPTINTAADGSGTAVTPSTNQVWLFASGRPVLYRGQIGAEVAPKWSINQVRAYAIRTYTPGVDGYVAAVPITLS